MYVVGSMVLFIKSRARRHEANRPDAADEGPVANRLQALHHLHGHVPPSPAVGDEGPCAPDHQGF